MSGPFTASHRLTYALYLSDVEQVVPREWRIWFNGVLLATFDERDCIIRR